jgi:D-amino-acid oxidase
MGEPGTKDVAVLGAGVIGLTTAVTLAEGGHSVLVRTAEPPGATTSAAAGALWGPWLAEPRDRVLGWARHTLDVLTRLATQHGTGVRMTAGKDISTRHHQPPGWFGLLPDARPCTPGELPAGYPHGVRYTAPLVDMPAHLSYLTGRLAAAGGTIEISPVTTLQEAAALAPIVLNCTGVGARALASDDTLCPVRGQHLVTTNPGISQFTEVDTGDSPDLIAIYPHEDHLVLGGTAEPGRWDRQPSPQTAAAILARCTAIEPRLRMAQIIGHRVGLRPTRDEVRLEERASTGHARLVHNYGHGGAGVSLAWGCALEVATLIDAPAWRHPPGSASR